MPAECYNDLDSQVVNVFRVLRDMDSARELQRRCELTPFAREEFNWSFEPSTDEIDAAHKLIVRSFMGHGSDSATRGTRTGFRAKPTEGRALPSNEWGHWSDAIPAFTKRLRNVTIENRDALEVIGRMDSVDALHYVDPPYVKSTRSAIAKGSRKNGYRHEMDDDQHRALAGQLHSMVGMVVLSGYPSDLYDKELFGDWERFERQHVADMGKKRTEVVWLNPACSSALRTGRAQLELTA